MWLGPLGKEHGIRPLILPGEEGGAGTRGMRPFPGDCVWSQNERHAVGRHESGGAGGAGSQAGLALLMDSDMLCWPGAGGPDPQERMGEFGDEAYGRGRAPQALGCLLPSEPLSPSQKQRVLTLPELS